MRQTIRNGTTKIQYHHVKAKNVSNMIDPTAMFGIRLFKKLNTVGKGNATNPVNRTVKA